MWEAKVRRRKCMLVGRVREVEVEEEEEEGDAGVEVGKREVRERAERG